VIGFLGFVTAGIFPIFILPFWIFVYHLIFGQTWLVNIMSGTLLASHPTAPYTPKRQIRPADIYASSPDYTPAEKLKMGTPELLAQSKAEQALVEVPKGKVWKVSSSCSSCKDAQGI
jgi:hypothetical protein